MLLVRTHLAMSSIHGIGLFASEVIPAGTRIWKRHPLIDVSISADDLKTLSHPCHDQVLAYGYKQKRTGLYLLCGDDARFINHSTSANCIDRKDEDGTGATFARTDIAVGEELTCDYAVIDQDYVDGVYRP